jgi:RNA polymerase sigma-70 factor (ECF subfamily)
MDETLLVQLARQGHEEAVDELFARVWPAVWHWAYAVTADRALADHVAQETIYRAFAALDRFDDNRPFLPWLKRITVNRAIDEVRRERRARRHVATDVPEPSHDPADERVASTPVVEAVRRLPMPQRLVIVLHYWLDCPVEEIASLLGVRVGTVASRMSRARAALKAQLEVCS